MTITRSLTSVTVAAALAATTLGSMATAASADGWRDGRGGYHAARRFGNRHWNGGPRYHYAFRSKRDNTGRIIALGLGALMLGIIASQAGHDPYGYDRNYD